jgi:hypothetical protein
MYIPLLLSYCSVRSSKSSDEEFRLAPLVGCFTMSWIISPDICNNQ